MTDWMDGHARGDDIAPWTPAGAARQAVAWRYAFAAWLRSEQAALMRYVPEQQHALDWWAATREGARADIADIMPVWLADAYGVDTSEVAAAADDELSLTARRIGHLCAVRSRQIHDAAPMVVDPPSQAALLALVDTDRYRGPDAAALSTLGGSGLLVFPHPILRRVEHAGPTLAAESADQAPLRAVGWVREDTARGPAIRVLDLSDMSGKWGRTGDAAFDRQVRDQLATANQQLPPLMFNGEVAVAAADADGPAQAQRALIVAGSERQDRQATPWSPETVLDDRAGMLASRVLSVFAHAVAAPLVAADETAVPTPGSSRAPGVDPSTTVRVYRRPAGSAP